MSDNIPSIDPADEGDLLGGLRHILNKELQQLDKMLPAKVVSFDRIKNRATVQPMISLLTTSGEAVNRATIASVPVFQAGGGGFVINFNLKAGDLGWIKASDRDISLFLQNYGIAKPNTTRKHSFSDAVFFPDAMRGFAIASEDTENAVLQSLDGSVKVSVGADSLTLQAGASKIVLSASGITIDSPTLTHNGKNIGATHTHPQGADSAGNTQQNTGAPL